jgi:Transcriptional Coactivator p15 (PC4)
MPKGSLKRKNQKDEDDDDEDEEEVVKDDDDDDADDDDDDKPQKKKAAVKKPSLPPGEAMYDLGGKRKLTFSSYKGQRLVGIREYYDDKKTGEEKVLRFPLSSL